MTRLLSCRGIEAGYGRLQVLFGVDFDVDEGEVVALLGTNGAGKSTLLNVVSGLLMPSAGSIEFAGRDITGVGAEQVARLGAALMPGGKSVFPSLTVAENLDLAGWLLSGSELAARTPMVLDLFPRLSAHLHTAAGQLSGGEQQMLSLAQALLGQPRLLMIDELSLGLAPAVIADLLDIIDQVRRSGTTIVLVEQSVNLALELADRAVFMEKGDVRFTGPTRELLERPEIVRSIFLSGAVGRMEAKAAAQPTSQADDVPALLCGGISRTFGGVHALSGVDIRVAPAEIVGLIGPNGAGKTTLLDCISGTLPVDGGEVGVCGHTVTGWPAWKRARVGLGRSFQDARLFPSLTLRETIAVALERHLASRDPFSAALHLPASYESEAAALERVDELVDLMGLGPHRDKLVGELSTGTRRVVDLACVLAQEPSVVLLDEPTAGIAQREAEAFVPLLLELRERARCALLVVEHDMNVIAAVCDRVVALDLGAVVVSGAPADVLSHPDVVASYLGSNDNVIRRSGAIS